MATIKFDLTDPSTKAVVESWEPNTQYGVLTGDNPADGTAETVEEETEPEQASAEAPGPAAVKAAMGGKTPSVMGGKGG